MALNQRPARILYIVTEDWYFLSHRLPMARAARTADFEVHVATNVEHGAEAIEREGFVLHRVPFTRGRVAPAGNLATIRALRNVQRAVKPDVVHRVALQPVVLGAIAAIGLPGASVNAITGLGHTFIADSFKARAVRACIAGILRLLINRAGSVALVQNPDDRTLLEGMGFAPERIALIPGSGVDTQHLRPSPEPAGPVTLGFVGRLLDDKGIRPLVAALGLLRARGADIQLLIAGTPDPANPASVTDQEIADWGKQPGITYLGHVRDIASVWARAHIAVLPSRREGLPKSLLEAAACGRPLVATDVPGCREIVTAGETGFLVPTDDPVALADTIEVLANNAVLREVLGQAARQMVETRFSDDIIGPATVDLYRRLTDKSA
jgi:glycosyltransferase involved in cell wall biosynthesis